MRGGQCASDVQLGSETCVSHVTDGKPSEQKREGHGKQDRSTAARAALAECTIPRLLVELWPPRLRIGMSSGYKGLCEWYHYRVSWPQEDSMKGSLEGERNTKQVNLEGRHW